jgi:hypothetical protein
MLPADFQLMVKPEGGSTNPAALVDAKFRNIGSLLNQDLLARYIQYGLIQSSQSLRAKSVFLLQANFTITVLCQSIL